MKDNLIRTVHTNIRHRFGRHLTSAGAVYTHTEQVWEVLSRRVRAGAFDTDPTG